MIPQLGRKTRDVGYVAKLRRKRVVGHRCGPYWRAWLGHSEPGTSGRGAVLPSQGNLRKLGPQ